MKTLTKTLTIAAISLIIAFAPRTLPAQVHVDFQIFYDNLRPYGTWVDYPHYGFVWIPNADPDFTPYLSNGHWIYTDYGWTWASYYDWGWAPFHYGRWDYDNYYGWFWIPGDEWGPAWVVWSRSDGYYGWTPLRPGVSINVIYSGRYRVPHNHWIFVRDRDFEDDHIWHHHIDRHENERIIEHSRIIHNTYRDEHSNERYFSGPDRDDVQKVVGKPVRRMAVHNNDKPYQRIENDKVYMYKPEIKKDNESGRRVSPTPVKRWESPNTNKAQGRSYSHEQQQHNRERTDGQQQHNNDRRFDNQQQQSDRHATQNSERRQNVQRDNNASQQTYKRENSGNAKQEVKKESNQKQNSNNNRERRR